ncbi:hypothetical protein [Streptomyces sp. JV185]|uniref:hypothetical protein n=1 Tax=Streptomyces sp. JV185 TaxID=858638 RepID=UPI003FA722D8
MNEGSSLSRNATSGAISSGRAVRFTGCAGYINVEAPSTGVNLPGVLAAGDVVDRTCRQSITAAGTAGLDTECYFAARTTTEPEPAAAPS